MSKPKIVSQEMAVVPVKPARPTTVIEKMDFEGVDSVYDALFFAFHPEMFDEDADDLEKGSEEATIRFTKFFTVWQSFLMAAGWSESEYFAAQETQEHTCKDCGQPIDHDELDDDDIELDVSALNTPNTDAANKPN